MQKEETHEMLSQYEFQYTSNNPLISILPVFFARMKFDCEQFVFFHKNNKYR